MTASASTRPLKPSVFSKLRGSFATKQHPQIKQEIQLDSPFREYAPGDSIRGKVHLDVPKPVRATHLVVRLHGFVKVITHSKLPGEAIPYDENLLNSTTGRRGGEYFGNGFAKLFEDEHVLCGDGRLYGEYVFQFELILPQRDIPSSIDFENGTITYLLSSTLTRPTTISPLLVEHCKIRVKEDIDIARIPRPRPQSVSLETIKLRRPVMQMKRKFSGSANGKDPTASNGEIRATLPISPSSIAGAPASPGLSDLSSASRNSSSTSNTRSGTNPPTAHDFKNFSSGIFSSTTSDKTITAQTEVLQGGCLPGDVIPIRVSVDHTKPIKCMQGVIVTLYRLARIDTHPALPLGPSNGTAHTKYEDYYPKSRTGLGGLSLSSAGSSRTFRQDLSQNIAPLIVDPTTLTAILKTSVQVPEHLFPSISGVPGSMISFKYFVEVVIDLSGKLGQDRILPKLSMTNTPQHAYEDPKISVIDREDGVTFSTTPGFNFLITDQIRRQKGVVYTKTEVLLGTKDSTRSRAKRKGRDQDNSGQNAGIPSWVSQGQLPHYQANSNDSSDQRSYHLDQVVTSEGGLDEPTLSPPETLEEPEDEKARIRRAEQTLLPSAPPDEGASSGLGLAPSAPVALDEDDFLRRYNLQGPAPRYEPSSPDDRRQISAEPSNSANGTAMSTNNILDPQITERCQAKIQSESQNRDTVESGGGDLHQVSPSIQTRLRHSEEGTPHIRGWGPPQCQPQVEASINHCRIPPATNVTPADESHGNSYNAHWKITTDLPHEFRSTTDAVSGELSDNPPNESMPSSLTNGAPDDESNHDTLPAYKR